MKELNISNALTVFRLIAAPTIFILILLSEEIPVYTNLALLLFILAELSDFFDGYLARKRKLVTKFGKLLDPFADKILFGFTLFAVIIKHKANIWPVWIYLFSIAILLYIIGYSLFIKKKLKITKLGRMLVGVNAFILLIMIAGFVNNILFFILSLSLLIPNIPYSYKIIKK